jgi:hypothetical protein
MPKSSNRNPLFSPRTEADFLACWPGATCTEFSYDSGLSVYVLRLSDGALVAVGGNNVDIWEKGMALLEKGFATSSKLAMCPVKRRIVPVTEALTA